MTLQYRFFQLYMHPGGGWFRVLGVGIGWKDTRRFRLTFSERNGYRKHLMVGAWSFAWLR